jgi:hypothetical protein
VCMYKVNAGYSVVNIVDPSGLERTRHSIYSVFLERSTVPLVLLNPKLHHCVKRKVRYWTLPWARLI